MLILQKMKIWKAKVITSRSSQHETDVLRYIYTFQQMIKSKALIFQMSWHIFNKKRLLSLPAFLLSVLFRAFFTLYSLLYARHKEREFLPQSSLGLMPFLMPIFMLMHLAIFSYLRVILHHLRAISISFLKNFAFIPHRRRQFIALQIFRKDHTLQKNYNSFYKSLMRLYVLCTLYLRNNYNEANEKNKAWVT